MGTQLTPSQRHLPSADVSGEVPTVRPYSSRIRTLTFIEPVAEPT
jgi:hypothetical protein